MADVIHEFLLASKTRATEHVGRHDENHCLTPIGDDSRKEPCAVPILLEQECRLRMSMIGICQVSSASLPPDNATILPRYKIGRATVEQRPSLRRECWNAKSCKHPPTLFPLPADQLFPYIWTSDKSPSGHP